MWQGKLFGRRLGDLGKLLVAVSPGQEDGYKEDLLVPKFLVSATRYIEDNVGVEGIYRMSGSQGRQKVGWGRCRLPVVSAKLERMVNYIADPGAVPGDQVPFLRVEQSVVSLVYYEIVLYEFNS